MGVTYNPRIVTDGLVLALDAGNTKSYPGSGTTWTDLSGNGNNGTFVGTTTFDSSTNSISFDSGSNTYVQTPFNSLLTDISISVWFNAEVQDSDSGSGLRPIVMLGNFLTQGPLEISMLRNGIADVGKMRFEIGSDAPAYRYVTNERYDDQNWHNAVLVKDNTTMNVYIDGNLEVSQVNDNDILYDTSIALRIGGGTSSTARRFLGKVATTSVYNKALTATEIQQNFNATRSRYGI
jgi:hypothetical protein